MTSNTIAKLGLMGTCFGVLGTAFFAGKAYGGASALGVGLAWAWYVFELRTIL